MIKLAFKTRKSNNLTKITHFWFTLRLSVDRQHCYLPLWDAKRHNYYTGAQIDKFDLLSFNTLTDANETLHFKGYFELTFVFECPFLYSVWKKLSKLLFLQINTWKVLCLIKIDVSQEKQLWSTTFIKTISKRIQFSSLHWLEMVVHNTDSVVYLFQPTVWPA